MDTDHTVLSEDLLDRVVERLGLARRPDPDLDGLAAVYAAWAREVPFDNLRKLIHLANGDPGPLPGGDARDFFTAWLSWGTGGTCWAANGALCVLLRSLGFDARRGVGTMMVAPDLPPNHGTVVATIDDRRYLVDASILFAAPLPLDPERETTVDHPAWGVRCAQRDARWHVRWRPLHIPDGLDCRIDALQASAAEFAEYHERTRGWSPFNFEANARRNRGASVVGIAFGARVAIDDRGEVSRAPLTPEERRRVLVEEVGIAPELVDRVPADRKTPPPPTSHTARR